MTAAIQWYSALPLSVVVFKLSVQRAGNSLRRPRSHGRSLRQALWRCPTTRVARVMPGQPLLTVWPLPLCCSAPWFPVASSTVSWLKTTRSEGCHWRRSGVAPDCSCASGLSQVYTGLPPRHIRARAAPILTFLLWRARSSQSGPAGQNCARQALLRLHIGVGLLPWDWATAQCPCAAAEHPQPANAAMFRGAPASPD